MPSRRGISVRGRLSLAFLTLILLSWLLNVASLTYLHSLQVREMRERMAQGLGPAGPGPGGGGGEWRPPPEFGPGGPDRGPERHPPPRVPPQFQFDMLSMHLAMALILSVCAGALLARQFTKPLRDLAAGARAFQEGELGHRIPEDRHDEFASVARTMNGMAARLEQQIAALEDDARRRQQILADMAHELRSPVATLRTMSEALRDGLADEPTRRERALQATASSVERLEKLVNDMIVVARLDLHQLPLDRQPIDLRELARSCVEMHRPRAEQAGVVVAPVPAGEPVALEADRFRVSQVLDNLLDNAVAHAGSGAHVTVSVAGGPVCRLTVADTGRGVAPEHIPFLFDPFYRVDSSRSPSERHAGLGLRIARGLVEAHGGTLTLESAEGEGVRVTVELPA